MSTKTSVTDYMSGRILRLTLQYLDSESSRRRAAGENAVADALIAVRTHITRLIEREPLAQADVAISAANGSTDSATAEIQTTYDRLLEKNGKAPSQRKVADESGHSRETVRARWSNIAR